MQLQREFFAVVVVLGEVFADPDVDYSYDGSALDKRPCYILQYSGEELPGLETMDDIDNSSEIFKRQNGNTAKKHLEKSLKASTPETAVVSSMT